MKKILIIVFGLATMFSCVQNDNMGTSPSGDVKLMVSTSIVADAGAQSNAPTRRIVDGTNYFAYDYFTMWFEPVPTAEQTNPNHNPLYDQAYVTQFYRALGYHSIYMQRYSSVDTGSGIPYWNFYPSPYYSSATTSLGMFNTRGDLMVYAVHPARGPYTYNATYLDPAIPSSIEAIPFSISNNDDHMVAEPQKFIPSAYPTGAAKLDIRFKHIMTALEFKMKGMLTGALTLNKISFEVLDSEGNRVPDAIATAGTYNARTGEVTPTTRTGFYEHTYNQSIYCATSDSYRTSWADDAYTSIALICPQIENVPGGKIRCKFYFSYYSKLPNGSIDSTPKELYNDSQSTFDIPFSEIKNDPDDATDNGILYKNRRYSIQMQIDNFIKYSGYPVPEGWKNDTSTLPDILI